MATDFPIEPKFASPGFRVQLAETTDDNDNLDRKYHTIPPILFYSPTTNNKQISQQLPPTPRSLQLQPTHNQHPTRQIHSINITLLPILKTIKKYPFTAHAIHTFQHTQTQKKHRIKVISPRPKTNSPYDTYHTTSKT